LSQESQSVRELDFASASGRSSLEAIENLRGKNVAAGDRQNLLRVSRARLFYQIAHAKQSLSPFRLWSRLGVDDAVKMSALHRNGLYGNRANARFFVNLGDLTRGRAGAWNNYVAEKNGERLISHQ